MNIMCKWINLGFKYGMFLALIYSYPEIIAIKFILNFYHIQNIKTR